MSITSLQKVLEHVQRSARSRHLTNAQFGALLVAPAMLLVTWWILWPIIYAIYLSFTNFSPVYAPIPSWIGTSNYRLLAVSPEFKDAWVTTFKFSVLTVVSEFFLGFAAAIVLNQPIKQRNLFRGALLTPWALPTAVASLLMLWMFNTDYGLVNYVFVRLGLLHKFFDFLGNPVTALLVVSTGHIWKSFPLVMVVMLAGLQTIPVDIVEAAIMDGANTLQRFFYITLPYLRYAISVVLLMLFIWTFASFTFIYIMTSGGPGNATMILPMLVYQWAFGHYHMSRAAAAGTIWLVFLLLFSIVFIRVVVGRSTQDRA